MNLFLRLLVLLLLSPFRPRCDVLGPARRAFRVWPLDLDLLGHVNNGVYLSMLDVARVDMMLRSGAWPVLKKAGVYPVVAAETIRFRRSLQLFQSFDVESQVIGWDERAFLIEHRFWRGDELVAEAVVRSRFLRRRGGTVPSAELLELLGKAGESPAIPQWIEDWNRQNGA
jgi:acyl-CoA thioesterase FadM